LEIQKKSFCHRREKFQTARLAAVDTPVQSPMFLVAARTQASPHKDQLVQFPPPPPSNTSYSTFFRPTTLHTLLFTVFSHYSAVPLLNPWQCETDRRDLYVRLPQSISRRARVEDLYGRDHLPGHPNCGRGLKTWVGRSRRLLPPSTLLAIRDRPECRAAKTALAALAVRKRAPGVVRHAAPPAPRAA